MEISILLFWQILSMFLMLLMGFALVKTGLLKAQDSKTLSVLLLYLALPCAILDSFQVEYDSRILRGLMLAFAAAVICHVILLLAAGLLEKALHLTAVEKASVIYSNSSNLIIPIITAVLGPEWVVYSTAYVSVQLLLLWTHGKVLLSGIKGADIRKILTNINLLAVFAGILLFLTGFRLPDVLSDTLHSVGSMVAPASMFIAGMLIAGMRPKQIFGNRRAYGIVCLRMLVFPAVSLLLLPRRRADHPADHAACGHHAARFRSDSDVPGVWAGLGICGCAQRAFHPRLHHYHAGDGAALPDITARYISYAFAHTTSINRRQFRKRLQKR